jgi:hypothetical protein
MTFRFSECRFSEWVVQIPILLVVLLCLAVRVSSAQTTEKVWIEFRDKGVSPNAFHHGIPLYDSIFGSFSPKAISRRMQALGTSDPYSVVTLEDVPVYTPYLDSLRDHGILPLITSKWENAASAVIDQDQYRKILTYPYILRISPVGKSAPPEPANFLPLLSSNQHRLTYSALNSGATLPTAAIPPDSTSNHYGYSASQLARINVPPLHNLGFDATGVHLGFLDTGFRWRATSALSTRNVIAEYDFVFHDSVTANQDSDLGGQDAHGTQVFSTCAAYEPDSLVGPAYNATIMLAKTEDERSETPREENNYANALEWMEQSGTQMTTSSLGYLTFDSGFVSYTYADLNGHTTISARAVERATHLGVLVLNANGNSGNSPFPYVLTPADADSILAVGALDVNDSLVAFSSRGPTSDGRIKPDICAPGVNVDVEDPGGGWDGGASGTSFATPLAAGCCALIFQAHPEASAQQIRHAVMLTGVRLHQPDTAYGWGKIDAYAAALSLGTLIGPPIVTQNNGVATLRVGMAASNGIKNGYVLWDSAVPGQLSKRLTIQSGADSNRYFAVFPGMPEGTNVRYVIEAIDGADTTTYLPRDTARNVFSFMIQGSSAVASSSQPKLSLSVSPNPAGFLASVRFPNSDGGTLHVYDDLGREVMTRSIAHGIGATSMPVSSLVVGAYNVVFIPTHMSGSYVHMARLAVIR